MLKRNTCSSPLSISPLLSVARSSLLPATQISSCFSHPDMLQMARETTDEQHTNSPFGTGSDALREKLDINWIQLNSKSNDLACSSTCSFEPIPSEGNRTVPTEAELFLLVCSLFPVYFILPIEDLVVFGMALNLFGDVHNISEGRCRVYDLIKIINHQLPPHYVNKVCLWEDKYGSQYVKGFNAKDLAKLITSKYQLACGCNEIVKGKRPSSKWYEYIYGLSLVSEHIYERPINLGCQQLALLQLQHREDSQSSLDDLFLGMKELTILPLDTPLNMLYNLRTLRLNIHKSEDMSWIGCFMNLELLSISTSTFIDIPKEMGQLGNLRLLDLRKMSIAYIPPGVLSKILKLEELYFPSSFQMWGCSANELDDYDDKEKIGLRNDQMKRINASISDIMSLSLNALEISIPDASVFPKNSSMFTTIRRFKILVPNNLMYKPPGRSISTNVLQLTGDAYDIKVSGICKLMSETKDLSLMKVRNLLNVLFQFHDYGFQKLQKMIVSECDDLEYIVDTTGKRAHPEDGSIFSNLETLHLSLLPNLKVIWHGRLASLLSFENLTQISIRFCNKMKYVCPLSIVRGSAQLKSIEILDCTEMNGIFYRDKEDEDDNVLHSIEELHFHSLPKLAGFLVRVDDKVSKVHVDTDQSRKTHEILSSSMEGSNNVNVFSTTEKTSKLKESCADDEEVIFPTSISTSRGNSHENISHQLSSIQQDPFTMNNGVNGFIEKYVAFISSKWADKWMQNLKNLEITFCDALQVIFSFEENQFITRAFNSLVELKLLGLRNLVHIWFQVRPEMIAFENLRLLVISQCPNSYVFSPNVAKLMVQLQKIYINQCERIEVFVKENEEESDDTITFPRLLYLELEHVPNLKVLYSGAVELPLLESLKINQCNKMKCISYKSTSAPALERILINGNLCASMGDLNAKRHTGSYLATFTDDDDTMSTINTLSADEEDGSDEQHSISDTLESSDELLNTPEEHGGSDDEFDGIDLPDSITAMDLYASDTNGQGNQRYMKEFAFADLKLATNDFSSDALLGNSWFGRIYKGWLDERTFSPSKPHTGMAVAIRKIIPDNRKFRMWQSEIYFLERLSHPNLPKLLGYCWEEGELLLVYEFMQRGSLADHLLERKCGMESLSWALRIKIAIGAAKGLMFLHTSENKVIHRDVKPSNILLDGDYNSRISDFWLAVLGPSNGDSLETTMVSYNYRAKIPYFGSAGLVPLNFSHTAPPLEGTFGYIDPLYMSSGRVSLKSDVYGFGVVLLQLMTGLKALDPKRQKQAYLADLLRPILRQERELKDKMDSTIEGQYSSKAMLLMAKLASKCIEPDPERRPTMGQVLKKLQHIDGIP